MEATENLLYKTADMSHLLDRLLFPAGWNGKVEARAGAGIVDHRSSEQ